MDSSTNDNVNNNDSTQQPGATAAIEDQEMSAFDESNDFANKGAAKSDAASSDQPMRSEGPPQATQLLHSSPAVHQQQKAGASQSEPRQQMKKDSRSTFRWETGSITEFT
jgi:hypothetical protein